MKLIWPPGFQVSKSESPLEAVFGTPIDGSGLLHTRSLSVSESLEGLVTPTSAPEVPESIRFQTERGIIQGLRHSLRA